MKIKLITMCRCTRVIESANFPGTYYKVALYPEKNEYPFLDGVVFTEPIVVRTFKYKGYDERYWYYVEQ